MASKYDFKKSVEEIRQVAEIIKLMNSKLRDIKKTLEGKKNR